MVSRLRPVDIIVSFEDRAYQFGETIEVDVELRSRVDISVREARMELACLARYTEIGRRQHRVGMTRSESTLGVSEPFGSDLTSAAVETESRHTYRGPTFLRRLRLKAGSPNRNRLGLEIPTDLPENVSGFGSRSRAKMLWSIVVSVDVAGARDVSSSMPVDISLSAQDDLLTVEQRRDQAREAAQLRWEAARRDQRTDV